VDYILGTDDKSRLFDYFPGVGKLSHPRIIVTPVEQLKKTADHPIKHFDQTRAFLKIQDGCSNRCSYCIVPFARGPSRSVPIEEVIRQAKRLITNGHREIVLTGVHIGRYGQDFHPTLSLSKLLIQLLKLKEMQRIRLTSLDPEDVTDELLEIMSLDERCCRHFHIPLQSGSDSVLSAMSRKYTTSMFQKKIEKIQSVFNNFGLGTDVIAGFPGETEDLFNETVQFIEILPVSYLHIFPFSVRKGTEACYLPDHVEPAIRTKRARQLRDLGQRKKIWFMKKWVDCTVHVLLESRNQKGWMGGFSSEYLRVEVPYQETLKNRLVPVKIRKVMQSSVRGEIIGKVSVKRD
jgi:threonylcarbamoyladenosine tRNA methylthiotransferase MtaB